MESPTALVRATDGAHLALNTMRVNGVSSAYVVDDKMQLMGLVTLDGVLGVLDKNTALQIFSLKKFPLLPHRSSRLIVL